MNNTTPKCILDRDIINSHTIGKMDDLGLSVFAKLCGSNRGAFGELQLMFCVCTLWFCSHTEILLAFVKCLILPTERLTGKSNYDAFDLDLGYIM